MKGSYHYFTHDTQSQRGKVTYCGSHKSVTGQKAEHTRPKSKGNALVPWASPPLSGGEPPVEVAVAHFREKLIILNSHLSPLQHLGPHSELCAEWSYQGPFKHTQIRDMV